MGWSSVREDKKVQEAQASKRFHSRSPHAFRQYSSFANKSVFFNLLFNSLFNDLFNHLFKPPAGFKPAGGSKRVGGYKPAGSFSAAGGCKIRGRVQCRFQDPREGQACKRRGDC